MRTVPVCRSANRKAEQPLGRRVLISVTLHSNPQGAQHRAAVRVSTHPAPACCQNSFAPLGCLCTWPCQAPGGFGVACRTLPARTSRKGPRRSSCVAVRHATDAEAPLRRPQHLDTTSGDAGACGLPLSTIFYPCRPSPSPHRLPQPEQASRWSLGTCRAWDGCAATPCGR